MNTIAVRSNSLSQHQFKWLLVVPLVAFFMLFFVIPVGLLFATSFNPAKVGQVALISDLTFDNYIRFFSRSNYLMAAGRSIFLAGIVSVITLIVAYPMAYVIAKTENPARNTFLLILVLASMQLDMVIRLYGMMVILGDNGLINQILQAMGLTDDPVALMYNFRGVVFGLVQFALPFMILTLLGVIKGIPPSLEEAARSLGASRIKAFTRVTLPASMPGILSGSLLVFALSISSYIVPALMGGFRVGVLPIHIYQQVAQSARFQFGATIATGITEVNNESLLNFRGKYLDKLKYVSNGNLIVIDKMPQNFRYIGLLAAAFPEAKIIHVKRNPAAVCWANYKQYFVSKSIGYCYAIDDIINYHKLYENLMDFWINTLSNRIYNLDYEQLTVNQESETRQLIDYLDLAWDKNCLSPQNNTRRVATASNLQVRQKVYQGSSEQWKKYQPFLNGALDGLLSP